MNNILYDDSSFPDVIDADSCWRSYWQEVATHEKIDLDVEVIEDPDNKYFCPYYVKKLFELIFLVPIWDKLLKTFEDAEEKEQLNFYNKEEKNLLSCRTIFQNKKIDKTELRATAAENIKRTYVRRRGSQRQFVDSYSKTERKISKKETKILTHVSGLREEQSSDKSDDKERNQATNESKFEELWQEKRSTRCKRNRDTYLSPPSKEIKFEMKMKNKENAKVETSENAKKSKKNRPKNIEILLIV